MNDEQTNEAEPAAGSTSEAPAEAALVDELLIEEISIDGMCGVY